jgi:E-phenylitaconyl-CoA hydratase
MSSEFIVYEVKDNIAYITLNRPDRLNAIGGEMADQLIAAQDRAEADPDVRVILLRANGRCFCSGADLTPGDPGLETQYRGLAIHRSYTENGYTRFKPTVGAIHGYALGAGFYLAVRGCDVCVAAETATFGFPEARAGVALPSVEYKPMLPFKIALEFMILSWKGGEMMSAQRAFELGVINKVVPDDQLLAEAERYCKLLQMVPPLYIKAVKQGYYKAVDGQHVQNERHLVEHVIPQRESEDLKEGLAAFREKREPAFRGR